MRGSCLGPEVEETGCDLEDMEVEVTGPVCVSREVAVCVFRVSLAPGSLVCILFYGPSPSFIPVLFGGKSHQHV